MDVEKQSPVASSKSPVTSKRLKLPEAEVMVGGNDCGGQYDDRDCHLIAQAFAYAAAAILAGKSGQVLAVNSNGAELAEITIGGLQLLELFADKPAPAPPKKRP